MKKIEFNSEDDRAADLISKAWGAIERAGFKVGSNGWSAGPIGHLHYKLGYEIAVITLEELGLDQAKPHAIREKVVEMGWELYLPQSVSGNLRPELQEILEAQNQLRTPGWITLSTVHPTGCGISWKKEAAFVIFRPKTSVPTQELVGSEVVT